MVKIDATCVSVQGVYAALMQKIGTESIHKCNKEQ